MYLKYKFELTLRPEIFKKRKTCAIDFSHLSIVNFERFTKHVDFSFEKF